MDKKRIKICEWPTNNTKTRFGLDEQWMENFKETTRQIWGKSLRAVPSFFTGQVFTTKSHYVNQWRVTRWILPSNNWSLNIWFLLRTSQAVHVENSSQIRTVWQFYVRTISTTHNARSIPRTKVYGVVCVLYWAGLYTRSRVFAQHSA